MNRESRQQDPNTIIDSLNTERQELSYRNKLHTNNNRNRTHINHTEQTLTKKEEMNKENLKKLCLKGRLDNHC